MNRAVILAISLVALLAWGIAYAGTYADSAHGHTTYGVDRTSTSQYTQGHCGHCHEQHASIAGVEPAPARPFGDPPDEYLLFNTNFTDQSTNFCYECHVDSGGYQAGNIINRSYSYNFGGNTSAGSYDMDIEEAFGHTTPGSGSSHYLPDFVSQILGQTLRDADGNTWSLPADINPCDACHNPHIVQRNYPVSEVGGLLATAVTRPSDPDNLWGDDASERMTSEAAYQAPYWWASTTTYEPANNGVQDGSNVPNYIRLCTDCHNTYNTIYSTNPCLPNGPRNLTSINYTVDFNPAAKPDMHGRRVGSPSKLQAPFAGKSGLVLNCTDCHEPHGSDNIYLIRTSWNGVSVSVTGEGDAQWKGICYYRCHDRKHAGREGCSTCHRHGFALGTF
jgi:hypothetical protein